MMVVKSSLLLLAGSLLAPVKGEVAKFWYSTWEDQCAWGETTLYARNNTDNGGVCAYVTSINRIYACPAPDATCWGYAQTCANGDSPGPNQIKCSNSLQEVDWCCQSQETCTLNQNQYNVCLSRFASPNKGVSVGNAVAAEYAVVPSNSIVTTEPSATPSPFSTTTFVANDNTSSASKSASSSTKAATTTRTTTSSRTSSGAGTADAAATSSTSNTILSDSDAHSSSSISGGAIAGIVIGGLVALAIICGTIIFLVLHRRKTRTTKEEQPLYAEKPAYGDAPAYTATAANNHASYYGQEMYQENKSPVPQQQQKPYMQQSYMVEAPSESTLRTDVPPGPNSRHELQ